MHVGTNYSCINYKNIRFNLLIDFDMKQEGEPTGDLK